MSHTGSSPHKYAISLRSDFTEEGIYKSWYPRGFTKFPDFFKWADNHPSDNPRVSMEIGVGAESQGAWIDGDCLEETMYGVCERKKI